jgi:hypothetical protein
VVHSTNWTVLCLYHVVHSTNLTITTIQVVHSTNWTVSCLYHVIHSTNMTVSRLYRWYIVRTGLYRAYTMWYTVRIGLYHYYIDGTQYKLECIATIQVVHSTNWTASCLYHVVHSKNRTVSRQYKDTQNDKLNSIFAGAHIHIEYVYAENQH